MEKNLSPSANVARSSSGWGRFFLFLAIAAAAVAADLGSKRYIFGRLGFPNGEVEWILPNLFGFQTSLNQGALWGLGAGLTFVLVGISFAALVGIAFWFWAEGRKSVLAAVSLALITGGILGNLWDRLALHGICWPGGFLGYEPGSPVYAVRDWILVMIGSYHWPNFNIADACLVCGVALMFIRVIFMPSARTQKDTDPQDTGIAG